MVLFVPISALAVSIALSVWAGPKLEADARIPTHAGIGGWDSFAGKRTGLVMYPVITAVIAALFGSLGLVPTGARLFSVGLGAITLVPLLVVQYLALRFAVRHGVHPPPRSRAKPWAIALVAGMLALVVVLVVALAVYRPSGPPATVAVVGGQVTVKFRGAYRTFALKSGLTVPASAVTSARLEDDARHLALGTRFGTATARVIAGTFTRAGCRSLVAIDDGHEAVVITLADGAGDYDRVVIEVEDPEAVVAAVIDANPSAEGAFLEC